MLLHAAITAKVISKEERYSRITPTIKYLTPILPVQLFARFGNNQKLHSPRI